MQDKIDADTRARRVEELELAIQDYDMAIQLDPNDAMAYANRGNVPRAKGELKGAIEDLNKAIELNPRLPEPYNNRGSIHASQGKFRAAIVDYEKALEFAPPNWRHQSQVEGSLELLRKLQGQE